MREHLEEYTKEQLLEQARSFELRKCSGLCKAALIERILECFCTEEMLRSRLACLTKEQMSLFRKACDAPCDISVNELVDSIDNLVGMYVWCLNWFIRSVYRLQRNRKIVVRSPYP